MKAYIKFFFEILPLAVFFTVNSVDNIHIVDNMNKVIAGARQPPDDDRGVVQ